MFSSYFWFLRKKFVVSYEPINFGTVNPLISLKAFFLSLGSFEVEKFVFWGTFSDNIRVSWQDKSKSYKFYPAFEKLANSSLSSYENRLFQSSTYSKICGISSQQLTYK